MTVDIFGDCSRPEKPRRRTNKSSQRMGTMGQNLMNPNTLQSQNSLAMLVLSEKKIGKTIKREAPPTCRSSSVSAVRARTHRPSSRYWLKSWAPTVRCTTSVNQIKMILAFHAFESCKSSPFFCLTLGASTRNRASMTWRYKNRGWTARKGMSGMSQNRYGTWHYKCRGWSARTLRNQDPKMMQRRRMTFQKWRLGVAQLLSLAVGFEFFVCPVQSKLECSSSPAKRLFC